MVKKSRPKGIDPAYPQKNFVEACYDNHNEDRSDYFEFMYGPSSYPQPIGRDRKSSSYGHSIGQRAGKLRLSGTKGAHRIGKR